MKMKFSKFSKKATTQKKINSSKEIKDIDFTCSVVHIGHVLTLNDINKNRSSKYTYLSF